MSAPEDEIDWSLTTWEGSRRAQLRDWMKLSLTEKWQAVEDMADLARETIERRRSQGLHQGSGEPVGPDQAEGIIIGQPGCCGCSAFVTGCCAYKDETKKQ